METSQRACGIKMRPLCFRCQNRAPVVPAYADFDQGIRETRPEVDMVSTPDCIHHEYIEKALESGADVTCEKPLTICEDHYAVNADAECRTGRKVCTTFSLRWTPGIP